MRLNTTRTLHDYILLDGWGNKDLISIPLDSLAALVAYSEAVGVQAGHNQHSSLMASIRAQARALRYHIMAEAILPSSDYLYDPRYAEAEEFGDMETGLVIPEAK